jgi:hypothetical protein
VTNENKREMVLSRSVFKIFFNHRPPPAPPLWHLQVTNENKREYVDLVARHRMTTAIREQIEAFQRGFWDVVPQELIRWGGMGGKWGNPWRRLAKF